MEKNVRSRVVIGEKVVRDRTNKAHAIAETVFFNHLFQTAAFLAFAHDQVTKPWQIVSQERQRLNRQVVSLTALKTRDGQQDQLIVPSEALSNVRAARATVESCGVD